MNKLKLFIAFAVAPLFCLNLASCSQTSEFVVAGLSGGGGNGCDRNGWLEFYTGLKARAQKSGTQQVEVFYGSGGFLPSNFDEINDQSAEHVFQIDESQVLELKLTRYVYSSDDDAIHERLAKHEDIMTSRNTLGYFMSGDFYYKDNSVIDSVEAKDLAYVSGEYGVLIYGFTITPIEDEPIKIFRDGEPIREYSEGYISSYYNRCLYYTIDGQNLITFTDKIGHGDL